MMTPAERLPDPSAYADYLTSIFPTEEIELALSSDYSIYQSDPIGFGRNVLGETYTEDIEWLMGSVMDNEVTIGVSANATGKTHGVARVAVWWYKCFPGAQVYTAAAPPYSNLERLLWGEIGTIVEKHPEMFTDDDRRSLNIQRSAKEFLTGVSIPSTGTSKEREAKFSGKHAPYLLFIIDEGDAVPDDVYRGIESCMSGGHCRLLIIFNPRQQQGEAYRMIRDRIASVVRLSAFTHPNVITGRDIIPGAVTRAKTARRINQWCRPAAPGEKPMEPEYFQLPSFMAGVVGHDQRGVAYPPLVPGWYKIEDPAFSYMVLGWYPAQAVNQVIARQWVEAAIERWKLHVQKYGEKPIGYTQLISGLDPAEFGNDETVQCWRAAGFVHRFVGWEGVDVLITGDTATLNNQTKGNVICTNVDAIGVGAGVAPHMRRLHQTAQAVKSSESPDGTMKAPEYGEFLNMRSQMAWMIREWLRTDPGSMLPPDELMIEELCVITYQIKNGKIVVMDKDTIRELLKRSPGRLDSLGLSFVKPIDPIPEAWTGPTQPAEYHYD